MFNLIAESVKIGELVCEAGSKKTGWLHIAETPTSTIQMPVMIVKGVSPGPVLCLTAGVHGCEYPGIVATIRLFTTIDPKKLSGTLVIVPVVNVPSFNMKTPFVNPVDNTNINRISPGSLNGTASHLIADMLFREIIKKSNYHIDLHSGDVTENVVSLTILPKTGNKNVDSASMMLARAYNLEYVLVLESPSGSVSAEAAKFGIPTITAEVGGIGILDEKDTKLHLNGLMSVLRQLKMVTGNPTPRTDQKMLAGLVSVKVVHGGIFITEVKLGAMVKKGQMLGEILDVFGNSVEKITAPTEGVIILTNIPPVVNSGDTLVAISRIGEIEK